MEAIMRKVPWNKGRLTGQKRPLKPKDVWAIRVRLQLEHRARDLALFNLAIDSKLRGCDLVRLEVDNVCAGCLVRDRATIIQKKTGRPVQFEITEQTRTSIQDWLSKVDASKAKYLFPSRFRAQPHLSTRQYARIVAIGMVAASKFPLPVRNRCSDRVGDACPLQLSGFLAIVVYLIRPTLAGTGETYAESNRLRLI
jgi:integrase